MSLLNLHALFSLFGVAHWLHISFAVVKMKKRPEVLHAPGLFLCPQSRMGYICEYRMFM